MKYSTCDLSNEGNKGIVEEAEQIVGDVCVVGHWKRQLPTSPCWIVNRPLTGGKPAPLAKQRPRVWRTPTWSWACMKVGVTAGFTDLWSEAADLRVVCRVLHVSASKNPNRSLVSTKLQLQGALFAARTGNEGVGTIFKEKTGKERTELRVFTDEDLKAPSEFFAMPILVAEGWSSWASSCCCPGQARKGYSGIRGYN